MGTTFVTLGRDRSGAPTSSDREEVGFWANDAMLELWLRLLALNIGEPSEAGDDRHKIRTQWLLASRVNFAGCVPHNLEDFTATSEGFDIVRKAARSLSKMIDRLDQPIQHQILNLLGFENLWSRDVAAHDLQQFARMFDDLLEGSMLTLASD
ncbi:hypothetical protein [Rhizobium alvei]|uniref:Uncharacterized protein n=1 Tax=Rhizobium alvei TaxID=1132659 RepID=A0ABT8YHW9_9HYPH|nr:hypothetical protein [Rhizobium alvei]MDO6962918.1 hypothetical protein [Rhizobium alvei]